MYFWKPDKYLDWIEFQPYISNIAKPHTHKKYTPTLDIPWNWHETTAIANISKSLWDTHYQDGSKHKIPGDSQT